MKIFNVENGVKKVYVQINDITMLSHTDIPIHASIFEKAFNNVCIDNDSNRMDFVEFTQPKEIEFFESLDWIVDYKQIRYLSKEEIREKEQDITNEIDEIVQRYNSLTDEEKRENQSYMQRHELLDYKMKYYAEILMFKQGYKQMSFPIVPDSDGFSFVGDDDCEYEIRASLDPNKILLFRKDGKKLSGDDIIPQGFLQMGMSVAMTERKEKSSFLGDYEISNSLNDDNQYLVIEFKVKSYDNSYKEPEEIKEGKGIKRLVKRIFNKNKK